MAWQISSIDKLTPHGSPALVCITSKQNKRHKISLMPSLNSLLTTSYITCLARACVVDHVEPSEEALQYCPKNGMVHAP